MEKEKKNENKKILKEQENIHSIQVNKGEQKTRLKSLSGTIFILYKKLFLYSAWKL